MFSHIFFINMENIYQSVCNWNYVTTDVTVTLFIYALFSMVLKKILFNLNQYFVY